MIILEGPDGSGKTTLAATIVEEFDLEYRRPSQQVVSSSDGPSGIALVEWWRDQLRRPDKERKEGVYDRCFWISEPIYQQAQVNRDLIVPPEDLMRGIYDLWAENPLIIFCMPPIEVQYSNVLIDGRPKLNGLDKKHLEKIDFMYWAFMGLWLNASSKVTHFDYTQDDPERILRWVRENGYGTN